MTIDLCSSRSKRAAAMVLPPSISPHDPTPRFVLTQLASRHAQPAGDLALWQDAVTVYGVVPVCGDGSQVLGSQGRRQGLVCHWSTLQQRDSLPRSAGDCIEEAVIR
jgi:hypothetical protein